jgi:hypothetical protein
VQPSGWGELENASVFSSSVVIGYLCLFEEPFIGSGKAAESGVHHANLKHQAETKSWIIVI